MLIQPSLLESTEIEMLPNCPPINIFASFFNPTITTQDTREKIFIRDNTSIPLGP